MSRKKYQGSYPKFTAKIRKFLPRITHNELTSLVGALRADMDAVREPFSEVKPSRPRPKTLPRRGRPPVSASFDEGDIPTFTGALRP